MVTMSQKSSVPQAVKSVSQVLMPDIGSSNQWNAGWTIGGGAEYMFAPHWTAKIEYLYVDLSDGETVAAPAQTAVGPVGASHFATFSDSKINIVRAGVNYKF
jgi:outer membrane immunogenic protein